MLSYKFVKNKGINVGKCLEDFFIHSYTLTTMLKCVVDVLLKGDYLRIMTTGKPILVIRGIKFLRQEKCSLSFPTYFAIFWHQL